jgi:hypothetical protein
LSREAEQKGNEVIADASAWQSGPESLMMALDWLYATPTPPSGSLAPKLAAMGNPTARFIAGARYHTTRLTGG